MVAALTPFYAPAPPLPYWLDALQLVVFSGCTIFVTLYLIHRSGDRWDQFGVTRPRPFDALVGFLLMLVGAVLWRAAQDVPDVWRPTANLFPRPEGANDRGLLVVKYAVSAFAEELVCRAYLITRLTTLLRSRGKAVVLAAAAFAAYHTYQGLQGVVFSFALGITFGAVFLVVRRVWPLALGHALYDIKVEIPVG